MHALFIHSDELNVEVKQKTRLAEELPGNLKKQKFNECLTVFMSFSQEDDFNEEKVAEKLVENIEDISGQIKSKNIVLYPYVHLLFGKLPSKPGTAIKIMQLAEKRLHEKGFQVHKAPFGWYKKFSLTAKGHPLAELSRVINAGNGEQKIETKTVMKQKKMEAKPLEVSGKKLTEEEKLNFSSGLIVSSAVKELFSGTENVLIDVLREGFTVDFFGLKLKETDFAKIEAMVSELLSKKNSFSQEFLTKKDAEKEFKNFKVVSKIVSDLQKDVPVYGFGKLKQVGLFKDAVLKESSKIGAIKLLTISNAYFKGDSQQESLTRIQGIAFSSAKDLEDFLKQREEAEKRSHLVLGKDLELFSFHEESPAMPFFLPKGYIVWREIRNFLEEIYFFEGYKVVRTPQIFSKSLWETSGHWSHYRQNMYELEIDEREFALKPMNCPSHCLIFSERTRSYKELPLRIADFGNLHRHELSGVVHGLIRVRKLSQDDSHIFCTQEQIEQEIFNLLKLIDKIYSTFGFKNYSIELSTRPEKFLGEIESWNSAETSLKNALKKTGKAFRVNEGDGAFYGPKIDLHVKDVLNRSWQLATIQLDYQMPQRFNLSFEGRDGKKHFPVIIHRALIGSFERFIGILIEHFNGRFPLWLSPVQVKIITVNDKCEEFAREVEQNLRKNFVRVELDSRSESIGKKVRDAQLEKVNYIITIGEKEVKSKSLAVRSRDGKISFGVKVDEFVKELLKEIKSRELK